MPIGLKEFRKNKSPEILDLRSSGLAALTPRTTPRHNANPMSIRHLSAITLMVRDMPASVDFYDRCGFRVIFGGADAEFTSLQAGDAFVNLIDNSHYRPNAWGRIIIRVDSADDTYERLANAGLSPEFPPKDAAWGERYFHITDPDGHELSFAEKI
jgi:catechol 2,3-dioxygenase-like lactoylglutathione lyase family enzyme